MRWGGGLGTTEVTFYLTVIRPLTPVNVRPVEDTCFRRKSKHVKLMSREEHKGLTTVRADPGGGTSADVKSTHFSFLYYAVFNAIYNGLGVTEGFGKVGVLGRTTKWEI